VQRHRPVNGIDLVLGNKIKSVPVQPVRSRKQSSRSRAQNATASLFIPAHRELPNDLTKTNKIGVKPQWHTQSVPKKATRPKQIQDLRSPVITPRTKSRVNQHDHNKMRCHVCDHICRNYNHLMAHVRLHREPQRFKCHVCDYSCNQRSYLNAHLKRHERTKVIGPDICLTGIDSVRWKHKPAVAKMVPVLVRVSPDHPPYKRQR